MKKILYYTDLMPFLSDSSKAFAKLRKNFEIFSEHKNDVRLVWHPYSRTEEFLKLNNCECIDEYREIVDYYKSCNLGDFDEESGGAELAECCDAYYGDYSDIIAFFTKNKKPVMIQNMDII